jgi:hypothetical protein
LSGSICNVPLAMTPAPYGRKQTPAAARPVAFHHLPAVRAVSAVSAASVRALNPGACRHYPAADMAWHDGDRLPAEGRPLNIRASEQDVSVSSGWSGGAALSGPQPSDGSADQDMRPPPHRPVDANRRDASHSA